MKKSIKISLLVSAICLLLISCGNSTVEAQNDNTNVVMAQASNNSNMARESKTSVKTVPIDVDLTKLSSTMVYSEVYQMIWHPENYVGKVIKMNGAVSIFTSDETNRTYYTCIIKDATACCSQGIEFRFPNNQPLPNNIKEGDEVAVVGEFNTYKEGKSTYCELVNAKLL